MALSYVGSQALDHFLVQKTGTRKALTSKSFPTVTLESRHQGSAKSFCSFALKQNVAKKPSASGTAATFSLLSLPL